MMESVISPLPANPKRGLAVALASALIWQIGACPCGCVDHNLWLGMFRSQADVAAGKPDHAIDTVEAEDCDHRPRDAFVRARTAGEDGQNRLVASLHGLFLHLLAPIGASSPRPACRNGFIETARFSSAQEMRAHLQVFLI